MAETAISAENKTIFLDLARRWRELAGEGSATPIGNRIPSQRSSLARLAMKTAGDYHTEANCLRELEKDATDPEVLKALPDMIEELEAHASKLENGA